MVVICWCKVGRKPRHSKTHSVPDAFQYSELYCDSPYYDSSTDSEESDFISLYDDLKYNVIEDPFETYKGDLIDLYIH